MFQNSILALPKNLSAVINRIMAEINYETLGRKVAELYPDIAKQLIITPTLCELSLIPEIFSTHFKDSTESNSRFVFIGVILSLYDPDVLTGFKTNLRYGVRSEIAKIFSVSDTVISHNLQIVRNYYMIYRKFKTSVDYISHQISEEYAIQQ